jgi:hypothetical protein
MALANKEKAEKEKRITRLDQIVNSGQPIPRDIYELEEILLDEGYDLTSPQFTAQRDRRYSDIDKQVEEQRQKSRRRPKNYDHIRNTFLGIRDYVAIAVNFLIRVIGPFVIIVLLFISEVVSVMLGISSFFDHGAITFTLAITLVAMYFAIEWIGAEYVHKYGSPPKYKTTLATIWKRVSYFFSLKSQPVEIETHHNIRSLNRVRLVLIMLIVILGIVGRLETLLEQNTSVWYNAVAQILTQSTLLQFLEYLGGGIIALGLLSATHFTIISLHETYYSAIGSESVDFFDERLPETMKQEVYLKMLLYQVHRLAANKLEKLESTAPELPSRVTTPTEITMKQPNTQGNQIASEQSQKLSSIQDQITPEASSLSKTMNLEPTVQPGVQLETVVEPGLSQPTLEVLEAASAQPPRPQARVQTRSQRPQD